MKTFTRILPIIAAVCFLLVPALVHADEALFVFQAGQPTARVYDAWDFQLLARPAVGIDSFHAVAVARSANPQRAAKFYVASRDSVVVLDTGFANTGMIRFGDPLPRGRQAIAVTRDGSRLLAAAGTKVYVIDTADDSIVAALDTGRRVSGILLSRDGSQVFAFSPESPAVRIVDITAARLLNTAITLPQVPTALAGGPGGEIFAASGGGIYDLAPIALPGFQMQTVANAEARGAGTNGSLGAVGLGGQGLPHSTASGEISFDDVAVGAGQRFLATSGGRLYGGAIGRAGGLSAIVDTATGGPLNGVVAVTMAPSGKSAFAVVDGGARVVEVDAVGAEPAREIALASAVSGVAAVTTGVEQSVFAYQIVAGNNQTVKPNTNFTLSVKAVNSTGGPVAGVLIFLEGQVPSDPEVACNSVLTGADGVGTITCSSSETAVAVGKTLIVNGLFFNVTVSPGGSAAGALIKLSTDFQMVGPNDGFNLRVEAQDAEGNPQPNITLSAKVNLGQEFVTCYDQVVTGATGQANFVCYTGTIPSQQTLTMTISDNLGRSVVYSVLLSPTAVVKGLKIVSGDFGEIPQNSTFDLIVQSNDNGGFPRPNFTLTVSSTPSSPTLVCPSSVKTNSAGHATITCTTGNVSVQTTAFITVSDGQTNVTFLETLKPGISNTPGLSKVSGDNQAVLKNSPIQLVVQSNNGAGEPRSNATLFVTKNVPNATATCPTQVQTNSNGQATILCTAGNVSSQAIVQVTVNDNQGSVVVFSVTILPAVSSGGGFRKVSGDNQVTIPNSALSQPLVVESLLDGTPQSNAVFSVTTSPSNRLLCTSTVTANSLGRGSIFCSAGSVASLTVVSVFVTDNLGRSLEEPFKVTIIPGSSTPPTNLTLLTSSSITGAAGAILDNAVTVKATDAEGDAEEGLIIAFSSTQDATFSPAADVTDSDGVARTSVTLGCNAGTIHAQSPSGGPQVSVSYTVTAGAASVMTKVQGDNQSGVPGQLLNQVALVVRLSDICGTASSRVPVGWSVDPPDAATLVSTVGVSDGNGRSSTLVRLGNRPGAFTVTATSGTLSATFTLTVNATPSRLVKISGDNQSAPVGQAFANPLVVEVQNDAGVAIPGVQVQFIVLSGGATIGSATVSSNAQGRASTMVTAGNSLGAISIRASGAGQTQTFSLTAVGRVPSAPVAGFVNYASFRPGWVPGSGGAIFGTGMMEGINGIVTAPGIPFPTSFRGVRVLVNGVPAPIIHLINANGAEQINLQVPFQTQVGTATVVIENNGSSVTIPAVPILPVQPGIFMNFSTGVAAALHASDFQPVTPANPARPNEIIALFLTGLGAVSPAVATNAPGPVPPAAPLANVVVGIDNEGMESLGAFYAPGLITAFQINFRVGADVRSGNRKLAVVADGVAAVDALLPVQR